MFRFPSAGLAVVCQSIIKCMYAYMYEKLYVNDAKQNSAVAGEIYK